MKIILNMRFPDNADIDIGSIAFDRTEKNITLCGTDINKLNTVLTRAACIGTYNAETFYFKSGDVAFAPDVSRLFMYESTSDTWYEQEIQNDT